MTHSRDYSSQPAPASGTALILGGGGSAGNAWLIGVVAGLFDAGLDVTDADLVVGTSAGATAAVQVTSSSPPDLFAAVVDAVPPQRAAPVANHLHGLTTIIASARDADDMRRRLGASTLEADATSDGSGTARWRSTVAARLANHDWPNRRILISAIDARTGAPVVFDRHSGVDLVDAVAASTSNGFGVGPYWIGDDRFLDGGYRRNENADLAAGCERVLVLSPLGGRTLHPLEWRMQLDAQVDELRAGGSRVETILPDDASLAAFGDTMMNLAARPASARAGFDQGRALAGRLGAFWRV